jgi:ribose transport system permease protein
MDKSIVMDETKSKSSKINYSAMISKLSPYAGLVLSIIIFQILTGGKLLTISNLQSLTNQVIITALVAIGAVYVFGIGCFDMSLGSLVCLGSVVGGIVAISTGNLILAFLVCMIIPIVAGIIKGIFSSYVEVPFFIFTIVLATVINAFVLVILGKETTLYLENAVTPIRTFNFSEMTLINVLVLGGFYLFCLFLFNYTGLGIRVKMLGGNYDAAKQTGMNITRIKIISFVVSALGVGLAAFLILIRVRTVGYSTAVSTGNDVMVALVLGGMPISGGPRTKISAGIIGAATITVLNSGLAIMGLSTGTIQICRGIVFLAVVLIASFSYRTKMLPR